MDLQQCRIQEDATYRVDSICGCNVCDEWDNDSTANTVSSSSVNVNNIETEGTGTIRSVVRLMCHIRTGTDDLDLTKIPKAFIKLNFRRMSYCGKAL